MNTNTIDGMPVFVNRMNGTIYMKGCGSEVSQLLSGDIDWDMERLRERYQAFKGDVTVPSSRRIRRIPARKLT